jgi:hypothetical protein
VEIFNKSEVNETDIFTITLTSWYPIYEPAFFQRSVTVTSSQDFIISNWLQTIILQTTKIKKHFTKWKKINLIGITLYDTLWILIEPV